MRVKVVESGRAVISRLRKNVGVRFVRGSFAWNVTVLAGGTALGQAITVLASPVLTRLYTPEDFGVFAVYSSILGMLSIVASLRYELAIPLPEKDDDAISLVVLCHGIVILTSILVGIGIWLLGNRIVQWLKVPALEPYLLFVALGVLLIGNYQILNYLALRKKVFALIAKSKLLQGLGTAFTQVGCGFLKPTPLGLVVGQLAGQIAGALSLWRIFLKQEKDLLKTVSSNKLIALSKRYYRFPLYASWAGVLNTLSVQVPILMLSSLFGSSITGFYSLAYRTLWIPTSLLGQAMAQVLLSSGSEAKREGNISHLVTLVFKQLVFIGLPCFSLIGLLAPELSAFLFGSVWKEAGFLMQWLTPWIFFVFITSPLSAFSIVLEKQRQEALFQSVLLASRIASLFVGWKMGSGITAIALFSLVSAACWLGYLVWILNITHATFLAGVKFTLREAIINLSYFMPLLVVKLLNLGPKWLCVSLAVTILGIGFRALRRSSHA